MFTGLIEETGQIKNIKYEQNSAYITIKAQKVLDGIKIGDSISINGACQTVISFSSNEFTVFASKETLSVSTFSEFINGKIVNLERALRLCDRIDGHIVSGHIDGIAAIEKIDKFSQNVEIYFNTEKKLLNQIVRKGSITIDGISLTVAEVTDTNFKVAVIPHTFENTNFHTLKTGDRVNLETDIIAKYIEKYLSSNHNSSSIDMNLLERNGFL